MTLGGSLSIYETSKPIPTVIHFLQQDHTYSDMSLPPSSATPCGNMGANYIQTTTHVHINDSRIWQIPFLGDPDRSLQA